MFAALHLDINSPKSGLFYLAGQPNSQKGRVARVNNRIISETKVSGTISVDQCNIFYY